MGTAIANMPQSLVIFGAILLIGAFAIPDTVVDEPPEGSKVESFQDSSDVPELLETGFGADRCPNYFCDPDTGGTCGHWYSFWAGCDASRSGATCNEHHKCVCAPGECAIHGLCMGETAYKEHRLGCNGGTGGVDGFGKNGIAGSCINVVVSVSYMR